MRLENQKKRGVVEDRTKLTPTVPQMDELYNSLYLLLNEKYRRIADDAPYGAPMDDLLKRVGKFNQRDIEDAKYWGVTPHQLPMVYQLFDPDRPRTILEKK